MAIRKLDEHFDASRLAKEIYLLMDKDWHEDVLQFLLTPHFSAPKDRSRWIYGAGSLYDDKTRKWWARTSDFPKVDEDLNNTYTASVIERVREIADTLGKKIGRVRVLTLEPKTCYSLHIDKEEFRFHIPLYTNSSSFFINNNVIDRMPVVGQLYVFKTNDEHTAVNAHKSERRTHLVFDTYE